jgi:hypothetical protein
MAYPLFRAKQEGKPMMNRADDLRGVGFGRRGQLTNAPSAAAAVARPAYTEAEQYDAPALGSSLLKISARIFLGVFGLICLEAMLSGTSLITPINGTFINIMRGIGFVLGIPMAILLVLKPAMPTGIFKKILIILFLPLFSGFAGDQMAWRISNWIEFGLSSQPYVQAAYPITYASHGRKGRRDSVEIDPFNIKNATDIAIPSAQFDALWPHHSDFCITVMQRRSPSGAIEILNDGVFTLRQPAPAVLTRCPEAQRLQEIERQEYEARRRKFRP